MTVGGRAGPDPPTNVATVFGKQSKPIWRSWLIGFGLAVLLLVGVWFGGHPSWLPRPLRDVFVARTQNQRLAQTTFDLISQDYYRKVDTQRLLNVGLEQAVDSLHDPYSHFFSPQLYRSFQNETDPQVTGIGVQVAVQPVPGGIEVVEVFPGSPAARAGLKHGDVIVAVDSQSLAGRTVNESSKLIRGKAGTDVRLIVVRAGRRHTVTIKRADVTVPVAASKLLHYRGKPIGYLEFTQFTEGSAAELQAQVRKMLKAGAKGLILDLRDNPGGLLEQAVGVASLFIPHGTIVTTKGRNQPTTHYPALGDAIAPTIPMAVLVDGGTASSAEIVTGALKDHRRAVVVGAHTYGKGVFQQLFPLPGGAALDLTVGEYYTPNGKNLGGGGVRRGGGIDPNIHASESRSLRVAERSVAAQIG